jgi:hypothetical protein
MPRQIIMSIPAADLLAYLTGELRVANIPDGSRLVSWWRDSESVDGVTVKETIYLRLEHESFAAVNGWRLPMVEARGVERKGPERVKAKSAEGVA